MDLFGDLPEPSSDLKEEPERNCFEKVSNDLCTPKPGEKRKFDQVEENESSSRNSKTEQTTLCKKVTADIYQLRGFHAENKGEREEMQDAFVICDDFMGEVEISDQTLCRLAYYAVFDGHGGSRASKYAAENLHRNLAKRFPKGDLSVIEGEIKRCIIESFKKTDDDFLKQATKVKPSWKDGTTAVTILAINNTLYISNLGDSKAVLCRYSEAKGQYIAVSLTKDHSPAQYEERMRIQKAGGFVRDGRMMGVLEVSRSIGDGPYKKHGVICLPDVKKCQLTEHDKYVIIACDGLWKTFTPDAAIEFTNKIIEDASIGGTELKSAEDLRWEMACVRLVAEAVHRLSADNVTVVIVRIQESS